MISRCKNLFRSLAWPPYSRLFLEDDGENWVLRWEILALESIAASLGVRTVRAPASGVRNQSVFYSTKYILADPEPFLQNGRRVGLSYFHGYPDTGGDIARTCYENLRKHHHRIRRIQASHVYMRDLILETGIDPAKVHLIPIGNNPDFFRPQTAQSKGEAREKYDIPRQAVVLGSFQKDGKGFGDGMDPKPIKGPDVFLETAALMKHTVPELFVFLSGPARGYVKKGLEELGIPYRHVYLEDYPAIGELFQCLDLYLVSSREEGGPKAILESMASGVPIVSTRVGQAVDLIRHGENGFLADVEDAEALAHWGLEVLSDSALRKKCVAAGLITAAGNSYQAQVPLWRDFFDGFVEMKP